MSQMGQVRRAGRSGSPSLYPNYGRAKRYWPYLRGEAHPARRLRAASRLRSTIRSTSLIMRLSSKSFGV